MSLDINLIKKITKTFHVTGLQEEGSETVYEVNITHNLGFMAGEAGIYDAMWRPFRHHPLYEKPSEANEDTYEDAFEANNPVCAAWLIDPMTKGVELLKLDEDHFKKFNPTNGWGNYKTLLRVSEEYLQALKANPDAVVEVWR